jgi:Cys-tRNA(Pro)/Cys-tRNA(Cys) deacylase
MKKTNVMRILDQSKIPYRVHSYDKKDGKIDGISVAEKIGREPQRVFKTLVAQGVSGSHYVFVVPVTSELNLKKAATASGEKKVQMIHVKEILKLTGYIRGGCSPIGMKKQYQTWIDKSATGLETVIISAGQIGLQIEIEPELLRALIDGEFFELTM